MSAVLDVPLILLDPDLPLPAYARPGDAGADLRAREGTVLPRAGGRALVPTGVALALPDGYAAFVHPRSGLALRHGVTCLNSPGTIDCGYRDEIKVLLLNTDPDQDYEVTRGDRIAQLVIQRVEQARFSVVEALPTSARGLGGFGHTGRLSNFARKRPHRGHFRAKFALVVVLGGGDLVEDEAGGLAVEVPVVDDGVEHGGGQVGEGGHHRRPVGPGVEGHHHPQALGLDVIRDHEAGVGP
jgi:dUTP pyrophosphatase